MSGNREKVGVAGTVRIVINIEGSDLLVRIIPVALESIFRPKKINQ